MVWQANHGIIKHKPSCLNRGCDIYKETRHGIQSKIKQKKKEYFQEKPKENIAKSK